MDKTFSSNPENLDIKTVDKESLVDIRDISVKKHLSKEERIKDYADQIGNLYLFRCGKTLVKISFSDTDKTMEDRFIEMLSQN